MFKTIRKIFITRCALMKENAQLRLILKCETEHCITLNRTLRRMREDLNARITTSDSLEADAARFRWMLEGNGYFMEENSLCGHSPTTEKERVEARRVIDEQRMNDRCC